MKNLILFLSPLLLLTSLHSSSCEGFRVALDIGHLPTSQGAYSARGIGEYQFNREVALTLYHKLNDEGLSPFFVNHKENKISLAQRTAVARNNNADIFVSIHHDSVKEQFLKKWKWNSKTLPYCDTFSGYGLFVSAKNPQFRKSLKLAEFIGSALYNNNFSPSLYHTKDIKGERKKMYNRKLGVYRYDNLVVLKRAKMPSVLVEGGYIINRQEELNIMNEKRMDKFTEAVSSGIKQYCKENNAER